MGFTLKWLVPPWGLWWIIDLTHPITRKDQSAAAALLLIMIWGAIANIIVFAYWIKRAFRRADRDTQHLQP